MNYPYIPHTDEDIRAMLEFIGVSSIEDLFSSIPVSARSSLNIPESRDEFSVFKRLKEISEVNASLEDYAVFLGAGVYKGTFLRSFTILR